MSGWPFSDQYAYSPPRRTSAIATATTTSLPSATTCCPELLRVTIPGRFAIVHCRIASSTAAATMVCAIEPFSDKVTTAMRRHGWLFYGRITIATDPVRENNQTNNLPYSETRRTPAAMASGCPSICCCSGATAHAE